MASTDATPLPLKNTALYIEFQMILNTGLKDSGATLAPTVSIDGDGFNACSNSPTEIGSSGKYGLTFTAEEMNGNCISFQCYSTTVDSVPLLNFTIYPSSGSKFQVNTVQVGSQTASAAGTVTFPGTIASATNITAGTITTVTNLTNAPSAGDFTSTMKTSLNAATPSVTVSDKTGFSLSGTQAFSNTGTWTGTISTVTTLTNLPSIPANWLTATGIASNALTAAKIATDAITSDQIAASAASEIAVATRDVNNTSPAANSLGAAVNSAASAGDPWATTIPGAYGAGTAGFILGTYLTAEAPTAIQNADTLLNRDMSAVTVTNSRSPINAFRFIRNGFSISGSTMSVLGEDDVTVVYTRDLTTDAGAVPITGVS